MENDIEKRKFAIREAKDALIDVNNGISRTREKSWQLLAFLIAINVYYFSQLIENKANIKIECIACICFLYDILIGYLLSYSLFPNTFNSNGGSPAIFEKIIEQEKKEGGLEFYRTIAFNYGETLKVNNKVLTKITVRYQKALIALICLISLIIAYNLFFLLLIKLNQCN